MSGSADSLDPPLSEPEPKDEGEKGHVGLPSKAPGGQEESLQATVAHLMAENGRLHGKLRGYQTLSKRERKKLVLLYRAFLKLISRNSHVGQFTQNMTMIFGLL